MKKAQLQKILVGACYYGDLRKVSSYLRKGARPNEPDERGYYPFHMACQEGHVNIAKLLVKNGANVNAKDDGGKGDTALFRAIGAGHFRVVKFLIMSGCDVNLRWGGPAGDTPLHIACAWGRFKETVALVNAGARVRALNDENESPLYHAIANGHPKIVAFLIGKRALNKAVSKKILLDIAAANKEKIKLQVLKK